MHARRSRLVAPLSAALLLLGVAACSPGDAAPTAVARVGHPAPALAIPDLQGDTLRLADLRGDVVLLNVWATWCPPCREEMPDLQALHEELGPRGLRVVAVSVDESAAGDQIRRFLDEHGLDFTVLHDRSQAVVQGFQPRGIPETFLIDRDGRVLRRWIGRIHPGAPSVRGAIEEALAG